MVLRFALGAEFEPGMPIIMDAEQTMEVCRKVPNTKVVEIHMETFDFDTVDRR